MPRLAAHFEVDLPGQCLVAWPDNAPIRFVCTIDDFDVSMDLVAAEHWGVQKKGETSWTRALRRAQVRVSRDESELPVDSGSRRRDFATAANEGVNRLISFFRYSLKTPFLEALPLDDECFSNERWTADDDRVFGQAWNPVTAEWTPGLHGELGVQRLTPGHSEALQRYLENPTAPTLFEELLSDAQTAWFAGNLRRAVLELAVACEILVKRHFFSSNSPAGAAFAYLEDTGKVRVQVVELLHRASQEAFGASFCVDHPEGYKDIVRLFKCRNKVAHRGELAYRDDGRGNTVSVDAAMVAKWWKSVLVLVEWLTSLSVGR